ncbi:MAG: hypothetical protein FK734_00270 [Asgard group archaeon]|nr:hypothetical protein [Asgard group archaeon]
MTIPRTKDCMNHQVNKHNNIPSKDCLPWWIHLSSENKWRKKYYG